MHFPALDTQGWVTSGTEVADLLFSHFFLSDYSQTQLYLENVSSFSWILQKHQDDINQIMTLTESTLKSYFGRYFNDVVVDVGHALSVEDSSKIQLNVYVSFADENGKKQVLGRLVETLDTKISKVKKINNG